MERQRQTSNPAMNPCSGKLPTFLRIVCFAMLSCMLASCDKTDDSRHGVTQVSIDTPLNGSYITTLSAISGTYDQWSGQPLSGIRLYIVRYSDGKYWDGNAWGGGGSAILPVNINTTNRTWAWQGSAGQPSLPSGTDPATGLTEGHYDIVVIGDYNGGVETRVDSVVAVGITAPPVTSTVYSWGDNMYGAVGTGALGGDINQATLLARSIVLDGKNIVSLTAGIGYTLAMTSERRAYGWGDASAGAVGLGDAFFDHYPVAKAVDMSGILAGKQLAFMTTGKLHSLALTTENQLITWGYDEWGCLGRGSSTSVSYSPVAVVVTGALTNKTVVGGSCGANFTVALTSNGKLASWGYHGTYGSLGDGGPMVEQRHSLVPVEVLGLGTATIRSVMCGGQHTLALDTDGNVHAFGDNQHGQLGDGSTANRNVAVPVGISGDMNGKSIQAVATHDSHSLALDSEGRVYAWGHGADGKLGTGDTADRSTPVQIGGGLAGKKVVQIAAGDHFSLALTSDNKLFAWGKNDHTQLCGATAVGVNALVPAEVNLGSILAGGKFIQQIACGGGHAAMLVSGSPVLATYRVSEVRIASMRPPTESPIASAPFWTSSISWRCR